MPVLPVRVNDVGDITRLEMFIYPLDIPPRPLHNPSLAMSNMSYCRFQNTLSDLRDCREHLDDSIEKMSDDEREARRILIRVCEYIALSYGESNKNHE